VSSENRNDFRNEGPILKDRMRCFARSSTDFVTGGMFDSVPIAGM